jgi:NADPH:quinone reductase-like Zn-dependent oxidoreductase
MSTNPVIFREPADPSVLMRAAYYNGHGTTDEDIEVTQFMVRPIPREGQVLIKVVCASLNPVDIKLKENSIPSYFIPLPKIIGCDVSGTVVCAQKCTAHHLQESDRVMAMMPTIYSGWGAACQYAVVDAQSVCKVPENVSFIEAASVPLVGTTVLSGFRSFCAFHKGQTAGKRVLIQAGSGGLGSFAIQYCKHVLGMVVYTTCSSENLNFVRDLGADVAIDYLRERFEDVAVGMDVVFDSMSFLYERRTFNSKVLKAQVKKHTSNFPLYTMLTTEHTHSLRNLRMHSTLKSLPRGTPCSRTTTTRCTCRSQNPVRIACCRGGSPPGSETVGFRSREAGWHTTTRCSCAQMAQHCRRLPACSRRSK